LITQTNLIDLITLIATIDLTFYGLTVLRESDHQHCHEINFKSMFDMLLINYNRSGPTKNSLLLKVSSLARRPPD
jgi:hypothetical protein